MTVDFILTAADRCDARCGAQAFVRVVLTSGGVLDFCGHHYVQHEMALLPVTEMVKDERSRINQKPSQSATV